MLRFLSGVLAALVLVGGLALYLSAEPGSVGQDEAPGGRDDDWVDVEVCVRAEDRIAKVVGKKVAEDVGELLRGEVSGVAGVSREEMASVCERSLGLSDADLRRAMDAIQAGDLRLENFR